MKAIVKALKKNYLVEFKNDADFLTFVTNFNDKIQDVEVITEDKLPELEKPVDVAKPSLSDGWKTLEKSAFVDKEKGVDKKGPQLGGKYAEFKYEPDKNLENSTDDKVSEPKNDSPALKGEEPKVADVEATAKEAEVEVKDSPKTDAPKAEEPKSEEHDSKTPEEHPEHEHSEEKKEEKSEDKEDEKKEDVDESVDAEIAEVLEAAGVDLEEGWKDKARGAVAGLAMGAAAMSANPASAHPNTQTELTSNPTQIEQPAEENEFGDHFVKEYKTKINGQDVTFKVYDSGRYEDEYGHSFDERDVKDMEKGIDPMTV